MRKTIHAIFMCMLLLISGAVNAQVTTASMSGKITSDEGAVLGATVIAKHVPSGTVYSVATNAEGRFSINGMQAGGPYTVTVTYVGLQTSTIEGVSLKLGENYAINLKLSSDSKSLAEVTVMASKTKFTTEKTGATTNINNTQIENMPNISRSITNIVQLSPYASGMSMSGGDGRSTNFTVDGANFNNNFGLSSSLPGGGNPISIDAIEEAQVVIAPFDVRQSNFLGGGINAITKSGTNQFKGTAYTYFNNQNLRGNKIGDVDFGTRPKQSEKTYGFTLGGPIIKNKLFFFVNAEYVLDPGQVVTWKPSQDGNANTSLSLSRTKISDMQKVKDYLINTYGYDPGSYTDYPGDESNVKFLGRIDWNINSKNRLSLRYNYTKNTTWNPTNGNSTDAGYRNTKMNRISQYSMAFSNSLYSMDNLVKSFSADLNSRFSNKLSNQLLVTYSKLDDVRGSNSSKFPFIDIMNGYDTSGNQVLEPYMSAGYELFTWNNGVHNNIFNATDNLIYYLTDHKVTGGVSFEHQMADNSYMRNGTIYYRYASLDDFLNQAAPRDMALTYGYNGEANPAARVAFNKYSAYLQDEWNVNPTLKLTLGLRAEYLKYEDNILTNKAILALDYGGKHIDTGKWPDAKVQFSPRVGFSIDVLGDQSLKVRGGTGVFSGRLPLVFFTNMPTNSGMVQGSYAAKTTYNSNGSVKTASPDLAKLAGKKMITDVNEFISTFNLPTTPPASGVLPSTVNGVDPQFKMPQVWKTSIAVDYKVPTTFPLNVTVEEIANKTLFGVMLKNYNLKDPDNTWKRFSGEDNRYIYPSSYKYQSIDAYVLSNTTQGYGFTSNITVTAEPIKNLNIMAAYTHTISKEITGMPGSSASSAYGGIVSVYGPQLPNLENSQYVVPDRIISSISYRFAYLNNSMATNISLFYTGSSPDTYSYTYSNDMNGDGFATDLIYIPSQKGDIKFATTDDETAFFNFMNNDKYLKSHKGKYAGAYAVAAPWVHNFDLRVAQDFTVRAGSTKNTLEVSLDFLNFGNLIHNTWGVPKTMVNSNNGAILKYMGKDANNVPTYAFNKVAQSDGSMVYPTKAFSPDYYYGNTWKLQLGLKYIFGMK